jgi:hypothetical protein
VSPAIQIAMIAAGVVAVLTVVGPALAIRFYAKKKEGRQ